MASPVYDRVEAPATPEEKALLAKLSPRQVNITELAGEKIQAVLTRAPGNGAPIGGLKVAAASGWFAARPSGTENIYKIYAESFQGADHLRRILEEAQAIVSDALAAPPATKQEEKHEQANRSQSTPFTAFCPRKSRGSIPWRNWPWTCAGRGIIAPTKCGGCWTPRCGNSRRTPGLSCRPSRATNSNALLADPAFRKNVDDLLQAKRQAAEAPAWFQQHHPQAPLTCVAYFSMEFMLSEALPIYSGGLGNVAGDQLKAASDLGVPVAGVGLLYQQGYFRQMIDRDGAQQALYPYNDPGQLPITPLRQPNGEWLRLEIALPGYSVWLRAWQVQVGRVKLYLLDSNDAANFPAHRGITSELYGGGPELRLAQEMLLGIGGWRLLAALGLQPEVCHLNEGHAAFAVLERARGFMQASGQPFDVALAATRAGNLFTTHTAVAAGFDRFPPALIEQYLGRYAREKLGIPIRDLLALGRQNPNDPSEPFNMAYLAIRGSGAVNGVSRLHGKVSRHLFEPLFPTLAGGRSARRPRHQRRPHAKLGLGGGGRALDASLWKRPLAGDDGKHGAGHPPRLRRQPLAIPPRRQQVSDRICPRTPGPALCRRRRAARERSNRRRHLFDPNILTLGFARRFATYKRPNLLLHDPARLLRLLTNPQRPVQLIIAGKAHPADATGQAMIQQWIRFIRTPEARPHAIFLSDYDMHLTERLVQGVDVWLNTPRRPWEASGTSGMKVLVNGGINLSELDGWWAEAYTPEVGWALGDGQEHGDDPAWDAAEAEALYDLLEREVIPEFYARDEQGIPTAWVARMRESMARLTPRLLRQPHGARIHRTTLPPGRRRLARARGR